MNLIIDAGNTNIVVAIFDQDTIILTDRIETLTNLSDIYLKAYFSDLLIENNLTAEDIKAVAISSVVSEISDTLKQSCDNYFLVPALLLGPETNIALPIHIPKPYEIGTDLVANAFAAKKIFKKPAIIIDFGTALTFTVVDEIGIQGVTIAPGLKTSIAALSSATSKLPEVTLKIPSSVIGKNTEHAIQAGVLYGYIGLVKEILERMKAELKTEPACIATGGLSKILDPLESVIDQYDPFLTIKGINAILLEIKTH